jgi:heme-degrading monooxygenase HmoA
MDGYVTVWEFRVHPDRRAEFERRYGPEGVWTALFRCAEGYLGTELLHDHNDALRYLTIDRWTTPDAYRSFHARFAEQYASLDRDCEGLTAHEAALGEYDLKDLFPHSSTDADARLADRPVPQEPAT